MEIVMSLILLLLRMVVGVVALLIADLAIHFAPPLVCWLSDSLSNRSGNLQSSSDNWFVTYIYHRWTGVWAFFVLMMAICATVDYVTGALPWFVGLPVIARALGCSAVLLAGTLILVILGKSNETTMGYPFETDFKPGPSWGEFNITWSEVFILSPLFVSEFLRDRLRT